MYTLKRKLNLFFLFYTGQPESTSQPQTGFTDVSPPQPTESNPLTTSDPQRCFNWGTQASGRVGEVGECGLEIESLEENEIEPTPHWSYWLLNDRSRCEADERPLVKALMGRSESLAYTYITYQRRFRGVTINLFTPGLGVITKSYCI